MILTEAIFLSASQKCQLWELQLYSAEGHLEDLPDRKPNIPMLLHHSSLHWLHSEQYLRVHLSASQNSKHGLLQKYTYKFIFQMHLFLQFIGHTYLPSSFALTCSFLIPTENKIMTCQYGEKHPLRSSLKQQNRLNNIILKS